MANITQTIPALTAGISQQPDEQKIPGQVKDMVNALPDVTAMLAKRPGTSQITERTGANVHEGKWFDISQLSKLPTPKPISDKLSVYVQNFL